MIDLSIVVVSWNTCELLHACLRSIGHYTRNAAYEIIVVDNASSDGSADMVARLHPQVTLLRNGENVGFARAANQGLRMAGGRYVVLLNPDTILREDVFGALARFCDARPAAGAVSPRILTRDGKPQPFAFGGDPTLGYLLARGIRRIGGGSALHDWATAEVQSVDWASGACLMVRREALEQVGALEEGMFLYFEDVDWCRRARRRGWDIYYYPNVAIVHLGGQALAQNPAAKSAYYESMRAFYAKHMSWLDARMLDLLVSIYRLAARTTSWEIPARSVPQRQYRTVT